MFSWLNDPFVCGIIGLAGLIIGVVGIIIAIFFFFKSKTIAKPQYSIENEELVNIEKINKENKISSNNIMLSHGNEVIEYLNKTTIVFSNKGRRTINEEDIANGYFTVSFDSNSVFKPKFIDIRILKCSRESLDISTFILDEKNIGFKFNYLV